MSLILAHAIDQLMLSIDNNCRQAKEKEIKICLRKFVAKDSIYIIYCTISRVLITIELFNNDKCFETVDTIHLI